MAKKVMKTMDGNTAAAHVSYAFTEVAAIYPITPSSNMAEATDEWAARGQKNIFGQPVKVVEMQSEAGAAGAVHGSLQAGALTTTYTASQGLLLMIPNMYKIAGELLPCVFNVSARAVASHALSIFGDHSDVMACRQTGFAMLASGSVQETMDLTAVSHLSTIKSRVPFVNFFDGFRTSHEIQKIEVLDYEDLAKMVDMQAIEEFRARALNPEHPVTRGTAQNPDIFFQAREASNSFYDAVPAVVEGYMKEVSALTGRDYKPFNYYGDPQAEKVVVCMGSVTEAMEELIDYLRAKGEKVGMVKVHLYRPFSAKHFFDVFPKTAKIVTILDRTKEPGAAAEPLFLDVQNLFYKSDMKPVLLGGRYGLGSKDVTPTSLLPLFENMNAAKPKEMFTLGIVDDVTGLSLPVKEQIVTESASTKRCKFWGLGSDGTVGANKSAIKIIGDKTDMYAQGYFAYDSKKSGGITVSHLRFGKEKIRATYLIDNADYIACHNQSYVGKYDLIKGLKKGGTFVLNCQWSDAELETMIPADLKRQIANNDINFYTIDATKIGAEIGLGNRINMIMQAAFFKLADIIPIEKAVEYLKGEIVKAYGKKGEAVVNMNYAAVDRGISSFHKVEVPASWKTAQDEVVTDSKRPEFIAKVVDVINGQKGDDLPVSTFKGIEDGTFPMGTSAYEKRGIAVNVPEWQSDKCIQCNRCALVCPHAAIRPFLLTEAEKAAAPAGMVTLPASGPQFKGLQYKIQCSTLDCTGCGNCADACPAKEKALVMKPQAEQNVTEIPNWDYLIEKVTVKDDLAPLNTVKNSQFAQPLLQFSGACAGCGETPYLKAITQLYGDRMMIANATGCSSIWGGSAPATVYCKDKNGKGPAWANSLFEDNAEYGLGMALGVEQIREHIAGTMEKVVASATASADLKAAAEAWLANYRAPKGEDADLSKKISAQLIAALDASAADTLVDELNKKRDYFIKKSVWIVGGDGWAYDIGYGGLDHVLASGKNVNVLVFDTEIYSNTGGQASKSTPTGAVAKFAASGKKIRKKDLGMIAATYGYVYVAQVAMGADVNQFMKAILEAEKHEGPSIIIAYAPCVNHGIRYGMAKTQTREKEAVDCGYWHLWRYVPELADEGKNPFVLDSKDPTGDFQAFLGNEVRYTSLKQTFPAVADELFKLAEENAKIRLGTYKKMLDK